MALRTNDPEVLTAAFSDRQVRWVCQFHEETKDLFTVALMRAKLEELMRIPAEAGYWKQSLLTSEGKLLSDEELKWIHEDDLRLLRWLVIKCQKPRPNDPPLMQTPVGYNLGSHSQDLHYTFIRAVDFWQTPMKAKKDTLEKLRAEWSTVLLNNSKLKWLDKTNTTQTDWAWDYVNNYINTKELRTFRFTPTTPETKYIDILSTFDCWSADRADLYELKSNLKQAWAQQKYRAKLKDNNKKQSTYALSNKTKNQLKALAEANEINLNQMLEYIIDEAYKDRKKRKFGNLPDIEDSSLKS